MRTKAAQAAALENSFVYIKRENQYTSHKVVRLDPERSVKRCYNCQFYGHISRNCTNEVTCGRCAGKHKTEVCNAENLKCANCKRAHVSGDRECPEQKQAVKLFCALLNT